MMLNFKMSNFLIGFGIFLFAVNPVSAAPNQFICSAAEAIACAQDESCIRGTADRINLPQLWKVNLQEKKVLSIREGGEKRISEILYVIDEKENIILFGADKGMTWSVVITKADGKMTMTSSTYNEGFIVHGSCSSEILK